MVNRKHECTLMVSDMNRIFPTSNPERNLCYFREEITILYRWIKDKSYLCDNKSPIILEGY